MMEFLLGLVITALSVAGLGLGVLCGRDGLRRGCGGTGTEGCGCVPPGGRKEFP